MSRRLPESAKELNESVNAWVRLGLTWLDNPEVRSAIGPGRAQRLRKAAVGAGRILTGPSGKTVIPSDNGLYFVPIPKDPNCSVKAFGKTIKFKELPSPFTHKPVGNRLIKRGVITLPDFEAVTGWPRVSAAAVMIHELVHEDQRLTGRDKALPGESPLQQAARQEAEAYDVELKLADVSAGFDGWLSVIVNSNQRRPDALDKLTVKPPPNPTWLAPRVKQLGSVTLSTAIGCQAYGYTPDGKTPVPLGLAEAFLELGIIPDQATPS